MAKKKNRGRKKRKTKLSTKIRNRLRKTFCPAGTTPLYDGERHAPCMNYMGPGTKYDKRAAKGIKGVNSADEASRIHDRNYNRIGKLYRSKKITRKQAITMTRRADKVMIRSMRNDRLAGKNKTVFDKFSTFIGGTAIRAKMAAENLKLLDPLKYSAP